RLRANGASSEEEDQAVVSSAVKQARGQERPVCSSKTRIETCRLWWVQASTGSYLPFVEMRGGERTSVCQESSNNMIRYLDSIQVSLRFPRSLHPGEAS